MVLAKPARSLRQHHYSGHQVPPPPELCPSSAAEPALSAYPSGRATATTSTRRGEKPEVGEVDVLKFIRDKKEELVREIGQLRYEIQRYVFFTVMRFKLSTFVVF